MISRKLVDGTSAAMAIALCSGCIKSHYVEVPVTHPNAPSLRTRPTEPAPSLAADTLSRAHWQTIERSWMDGRVEHFPAITGMLLMQPEKRGGNVAYPDVASVSGARVDAGSAALEGIAAPPAAAFFLLTAPAALLPGGPHWITIESPARSYEKLPVGGTGL